METILIILYAIPGGLLGFLIYILINAERASGRWTCQCRHCQHQNPGQTDSEVTNPLILKAESFESGTSYLSPYPNVCQDCSEIPEPPPVTDPLIVDYYYDYYCHYYDCHHPTNSQRDSEAPKPPPVTDPHIVYYCYYYFSYYYRYHYANDCQTASEITNAPSSTTESSRHRISRWRPKNKRRALSSRIQGTVASTSTAAVSSNSPARGKQQINIGRARASNLKSVYMTSWASRIPRPINRDRLHCGSRPKKVTFGEIRVIQFYK
ncbi:uncharacterized protein NFIA_008070 [Aspergillus fischeri NRRL 181]|uniref:Uncharacterized protein n=1 Tax=Neosartorya fischeri (strain ATCC 1020 / DSM 3700 / CBS 544.65 / FGSC A1164 / JCM 1740 / NRRL 181 / WB 181) TaxID=331117 RepID=A1D137_NEOFI|nr:uncharacterized protein NFIA_008070 [Aspergillus fischeri NRRL 181]EAW22130.1 hypothetical protein NFIA_008070 [Aspergillus fischeri NRRL 181]KAG2010846.1 hypothetical protein GB937_007614 [Aspergillus fischeri]